MHKKAQGEKVVLFGPSQIAINFIAACAVVVRAVTE